MGPRPSEAALDITGDAASKLGGGGWAGRRAVERPSSSAVVYGKFSLILADHCSLWTVTFLRPVQRCGTNCIRGPENVADAYPDPAADSLSTSP
jgi:hypothetical protein